jgi:hypothetical protein
MSRLETFIDDLNGAVRQNPAAAGLIGAGILWIAFGNSNMRAVGRKLPSAARATTNALSDSVSAVSSRVGEGLASTTRQVRENASAVGDSVSQGASAAGSAAQAGYDALTSPLRSTSEQRASSEYARHFPPAPSNRLTEMLESQPLLIAAIGLGVGAAIASAFPTTSVEKDWIGSASDSTKGRIKEVAQDSAHFVAERITTVAEEMTDEAIAQNLTPSAIKAEAQAVAGKVKDIAATAAHDGLKANRS